MNRLLPISALGIVVALFVYLVAHDATGTVGETSQGKRPGRYRSVLIEGVPHEKQKPDYCGEACVAMWMRKLGRPLNQDGVFRLTGVDPRKNRGAYTKELAHALERLGFEIGPVWFKVAVSRLGAEMEAQWARLYRDLRQGIPSIICTRYDEAPDTTEHFRLVLGYDAARDEVIYHEPAVAKGRYRRMRRSRFLSLWPLRYGKTHYTVIRLALRAGARTGYPSTPPRLGSLKTQSLAPDRDSHHGPISVAETGPHLTTTAYARHIQALRRRLPGPGFSIVLERPFVVIGNDTPERVRQYAARTVRWAVQRLKQSYFTKDPKQILNIWLFRDARSYRHYVTILYGEKPDTPYGFYSSSKRGLFMNIATGGGTLVHEIVHPFIEANFPSCPAWFNEGLGSLYEQASERDGQIIGLTNWRLAGLQTAIRKGGLTRFRSLLGQNEKQFYRDVHGTNYAQSRYLLYYLQERRLLRRYYRAFLENRRRDPSGYKTLRKILGNPDMTQFQRQWERYVLGLRFNG